jgi:hypothetical protein
VSTTAPFGIPPQADPNIPRIAKSVWTARENGGLKILITGGTIAKLTTKAVGRDPAVSQFPPERETYELKGDAAT